MKREVITKRKANDKFEPPEDAIFTHRPLLAECCCDPVFDDGSPREVWSLSCNWTGPMVTVSLNDKEAGRSINTTAPTLDEALSALESLLETPARPWRYWAKGKKRG